MNLFIIIFNRTAEHALAASLRSTIAIYSHRLLWIWKPHDSIAHNRSMTASTLKIFNNIECSFFPDDWRMKERRKEWKKQRSPYQWFIENVRNGIDSIASLTKYAYEIHSMIAVTRHHHSSHYSIDPIPLRPNATIHNTKYSPNESFFRFCFRLKRTIRFPIFCHHRNRNKKPIY